MHCPYCLTQETMVLDSREAEGGSVIRRRRECSQCQRRFTTYERIEQLCLKVIKKDGSKEDFDREKIKKGLIKATFKRPVSLELIDQIVTEVESKLRLRCLQEVKSWEIGNLVINRLKKVDDLAYLLFASVYRDFDSVEDFLSEINKIKKE